MSYESIKLAPNASTQYDLTTSAGCVAQLIRAYEMGREVQRLSDEALAAYLNIDGNSIDTLLDEFDAAGLDIERSKLKKTFQNRQSILRGKGLVARPAGRGRRTDLEVPAREPQVIDVTPEPEPDDVLSDEDKAAAAAIAAKFEKLNDRAVVLLPELAERNRELEAENAALKAQLGDQVPQEVADRTLGKAQELLAKAEARKENADAQWESAKQRSQAVDEADPSAADDLVHRVVMLEQTAIYFFQRIADFERDDREEVYQALKMLANTIADRL